MVSRIMTNDRSAEIRVVSRSAWPRNVKIILRIPATIARITGGYRQS